MKVVEFYYEFIKSKGISKVFGVPGSYVMPLWQQFCEADKVQLVLARHESGAAFMADGWSRENKKVGVVLTTIGPGITNAITGIAAAYYDSIPMIIISGYSAVSEFDKGGFQNGKASDRGINTEELLKNITKAVFMPKDANEAVRDIQNAYRIATEGRKGPVHILLPKDVQIADCKEVICKKQIEMTDKNTIDDRVFEEIKKAKRPILFSGWGCFLADAQKERDEFVNQNHIPLISSTKGVAGIYETDCSLFLGVTGTITRPDTLKKISMYHPDLWIFVGSSISQNSFMELNDVCDSTVIQVDIDEKQKNQYHKVDYFVNCDAKIFFKEALKRKDLKKDTFIFSEIEEPSPSSFFDLILDRFLNQMPKGTVLVPDAGNHWLEALYWYPSKMKFDIRTNAGLASMGHAIGASIGMKMASNDKEIVCLTGDGSFLMSGAEISVAVQNKLHMLFLVYDNQGLGRVRVGQSLTGKYIASAISDASIEKIASGLGAKAAVIENEDVFDSYLKLYRDSDETWVFDIVEKEDVIPTFLRMKGTIN